MQSPTKARANVIKLQSIKNVIQRVRMERDQLEEGVAEESDLFSRLHRWNLLESSLPTRCHSHCSGAIKLRSMLSDSGLLPSH
jgi:hypothetical protein